MLPDWGFSLHFPYTNDVECFYVCALLVILISSLKKSYLNYLPTFKIGLFVLLLGSRSSFYVLDIGP